MSVTCSTSLIFAARDDLGSPIGSWIGSCCDFEYCSYCSLVICVSGEADFSRAVLFVVAGISTAIANGNMIGAGVAVEMATLSILNEEHNSHHRDLVGHHHSRLF
jgi:hypothetical protein